MQAIKVCLKILVNGGEILISELHPTRGNAGSLAHFKTEQGDEIKLTSSVHTEDHIAASALKNQLRLNFKKSFQGNEALVIQNQKWSKYLGIDMIQLWSFKLARDVVLVT